MFDKILRVAQDQWSRGQEIQFEQVAQEADIPFELFALYFRPKVHWQTACCDRVWDREIACDQTPSHGISLPRLDLLWQ